jgi:hypothetical protein
MLFAVVEKNEKKSITQQGLLKNEHFTNNLIGSRHVALKITYFRICIKRLSDHTFIKHATKRMLYTEIQECYFPIGDR